MDLAKRLLEMPESPIRKLVPFAEAARQKGIKVYHLNIGDPDIETPQIMLDELRNFSPKIIRYCNSKGEKVFVEAMLEYYNDGVLKGGHPPAGGPPLRMEHIQITMGGSEAILWTMLAVCNPGEEIIVFEPFYANYNGFSQMAGVKLVPILTKIENGFHLPEISEIEKKITSRTRGILICNPSNPTGTLYTFEELDKLVQLAKKHNLYLLSDEVYREFVYDSGKAISVLQFDYPEGLIVLDSLSKRYSLCGARLGCIVSRNTDLISQVLKFGQARLSAGFIDQLMASKLIEVKPEYMEKVRIEYEKRRDLVVAELNKINGVVCRKPEGAFYIIAKLPVKNAEDFAKWLLTDFSDNKETVIVAPAAGFYATKGMGREEIRIAYVLNRDKLMRSMQLLKLAIEKYNVNG